MHDIIIAVVQIVPRTPGKPPGWMPPVEALREVGMPEGVCIDWAVLRTYFTKFLPRMAAEDWRN